MVTWYSAGDSDGNAMIYMVVAVIMDSINNITAITRPVANGTVQRSLSKEQDTVDNGRGRVDIIALSTRG